MGGHRGHGGAETHPPAPSTGPFAGPLGCASPYRASDPSFQQPAPGQTPLTLSMPFIMVMVQKIPTESR